MVASYRAGLVGEIVARARRRVEDCVGAAGGARVVVLASGGLDSAVLLKLLDVMGYRIIVATINTRSRSPRELEALRDIVAYVNNLEAFHEIEAPDLLEYVELSEIGYRGHVEREPYYIPARNVIFLGYAAYIAEIHGARAILTAHNRGDGRALPDASEDFMAIMSKALSSYVDGLRICAPFSDLDKVEVAVLGVAIGAPIDKSWSCYDNKNRPCGTCRGCVEREKAIAAARKVLEGTGSLGALGPE